MSNTPETVQVGDGATQSCGSDSYPFTVVEVNKTGKTIVVQADTYRASDDMKASGQGIYGQQDYVYERNPDAGRQTYTWRKCGAYFPKGAKTLRGHGLYVGSRRYYYDPSF